MTTCRAVTRIKRPPPRNPEPYKPKGIYGAADIGLLLGYSTKFLQTLEDILHEQWKNLAKSETEDGGKRKRTRTNRGDIIQTGCARGVQEGAFTEEVLNAIKGRGKFTSKELAKELGEDIDRVNNAIHGLRKSKVIVSADGVVKRGRVNYWRHADGTFTPKEKVTQSAEMKVGRVRAFMAKAKEATRLEIEESTGLTKDQVLQAISPMKDRGEVSLSYVKGRGYVWKVSKGEGK